MRKAMEDAVVVQILNPQSALLFLAFLPQFVRPERGSVVGQVFALVLSSAIAFSASKLAGALYLVYLGIRRLLERDRLIQEGRMSREPLGKTFWEAVTVSLLNPKSALFFLAFLPQFVDPGRGPVAHQVLALGVVFVSIALVSDAAYALAAGTLGAYLRPTAERLRAQRWFSGLSYVGLELATAIAGNGEEP